MTTYLRCDRVGCGLMLPEDRTDGWLDFSDGTHNCIECRAVAMLERTRAMGAACPDPLIPGWTIEQCWDAKKCSCSEGAALGYVPTTLSLTDDLMAETGYDPHRDM